jgi:hypothetical protein
VNSADLGKRSREDEAASFFNWFSPDDQDLDLGETIKEDLWPNPAKYYHGEVEEDEEEAEEDDEESPEGEEAEEEGEGEEEGDEEEEDD